ncbi:hypothetical protein [Macrococcoides caseolyticum]|uniref:hypothetical protein n=1 Tax=Macrococcoides caseolyticum TaxID=69966 RepID=UPI001F1B0953|nr:hypothetical protein [Macrococcus caseolyticus]MCE4957384.1 hypothetical protein [Macrococcus caseolyticus]
MRQFYYGLALFIFLALPPIRTLFESIMVMHMHMQMMLLFIAGWLMGKLVNQKLIKAHRYNTTGMPGLIIFIFLFIYWMLPRAMDEALEYLQVEAFKFVSIPLIGMLFRDSMAKLNHNKKFIIYTCIAITFSILAYFYIFSETTLCNNYLENDQLAVGYGFIFIAISVVLFMFIQIKDSK